MAPESEQQLLERGLKEGWNLGQALKAVQDLQQSSKA
jgi:hypothetical protein